MEPTTELVKIDYEPDALARLEAIAQECGIARLSVMGRFQQAFTMAKGIKLIRGAITEKMLDDIMALQNTRIGFKTDKAQGGYDKNVVKEVVIEALLRGARVVGNEFNIIAGGFYATKEFFVRAMRDMEGLTNLVLQPGVPMMHDGNALVPYIARWVWQGKPDQMECIAVKTPDGKTLLQDNRLAIRVNQGMGPDAILGKAERKMRARIYNQITGSTHSEEDADEARGGGNGSSYVPGKTMSQTIANRLGQTEGTQDSTTQQREAGDEGDGSISPNLAGALQAVEACKTSTNCGECADTYDCPGSLLTESEKVIFREHVAGKREEINAARGKKPA